MKKLPLSLFSKLSNCYSRNVEDEEIDKLISSLDLLPDEKPKQLLYYTRTSSGEVKPNDKQGIKSLNIPIGKGATPKSPKTKKIIGSDLTAGYKAFKKPSSSDVYRLDPIFFALKYYLENAEDQQKSLRKLRSSIISLRRNMLMIMLIPLHPWKECRFNVIYWKGQIVLDFDWEYFEDDISTKMSKISLSRRNNTELLMYTGFKFEELITSETNKDDFYSLVAQDFGTFNTIITAEIDATIDSDTELSSYVELKTHSQTKSQIDYKLGSKLISSWCQTKLVGGKHVVVGFRSKGYNLSSIKKYETNEISNLLNLKPPKFPDNTSITCGRLVKWYICALRWIVDLVQSEMDGKDSRVFKMHYHPESDAEESYLSLENVDDASTNATFNDTIPPWFQDYFTELITGKMSFKPK